MKVVYILTTRHPKKFRTHNMNVEQIPYMRKLFKNGRKIVLCAKLPYEMSSDELYDYDDQSFT